MAKVIVYLEGGIVQNVVMDEDTEVMIVDLDTPENDDDEDNVFVLNDDECHAYRAPVNQDTLIPGYVEEQFNDFSRQEQIKLVQKCFKN